MHHAVAVERVVELERGVQRVLGVAQVDAVEVVRDLALDDVRSSASHSVVCGRHGPVRYGWSSSSGSVDRNLPTISGLTAAISRPHSRRSSPWWRCCRRS